MDAVSIQPAVFAVGSGDFAAAGPDDDTASAAGCGKSVRIPAAARRPAGGRSHGGDGRGIGEKSPAGDADGAAGAGTVDITGTIFKLVEDDFVYNLKSF